MLTGVGKFNIVILFIFQSNENIPADMYWFCSLSGGRVGRGLSDYF